MASEGSSLSTGHTEFVWAFIYFPSGSTGLCLLYGLVGMDSDIALCLCLLWYEGV